MQQVADAMGLLLWLDWYYNDYALSLTHSIHYCNTRMMPTSFSEPCLPPFMCTKCNTYGCPGGCTEAIEDKQQSFRTTLVLTHTAPSSSSTQCAKYMIQPHTVAIVTSTHPTKPMQRSSLILCSQGSSYCDLRLVRQVQQPSHLFH
jgi:hypothetical protein